MNQRIALKPAEIASAFSTDDQRREFPAILGVPQVARLFGLRSAKPIYFWVSQGRLDGTFRKRGKRLFFWRDRLIDRLFNGPAWESRKNEP